MADNEGTKVSDHKIIKASTGKLFWAGLRNRIRTKRLIMSNLKSKLAEECKTRTRAYFSALPPKPPLSEKAQKAVQIIRDSNAFGCKTSHVSALVSALLGEEIGYAVGAMAVPQPKSGVLIVFLSHRISPGNWVPSLCIGEDGKKALFINNIEDKTVGSGLGSEQIATARQATDEEIDAYFTAMNSVSLRTTLKSDFGFETATKD